MQLLEVHKPAAPHTSGSEVLALTGLTRYARCWLPFAPHANGPCHHAAELSTRGNPAVAALGGSRAQRYSRAGCQQIVGSGLDRVSKEVKRERQED
eukprot:1836776-Amphidinium_carterae.1